MSSYPLRMPKSLKDRVTLVAKRDGTSVNQFITSAVAEKLSALDTEDFFIERAANADIKEFKKLLKRKGGEKPRSGDEIA